MAGAAIRKAQRQPAFGRQPAQAIDRSVRQRAGAARAHRLFAARHRDHVRIVRSQDDGIHEQALARSDPIGLSLQLVDLEQRLRLGIENLIPVAGRLEPRHVNGIAAQIFDGNRVVLFGGHMRRARIEAGQRGRPFGKRPFVPNPWYFRRPFRLRVLRKDHCRSQRNDHWAESLDPMLEA